MGTEPVARRPLQGQQAKGPHAVIPQHGNVDTHPSSEVREKSSWMQSPDQRRRLCQRDADIHSLADREALVLSPSRSWRLPCGQMTDSTPWLRTRTLTRSKAYMLADEVLPLAVCPLAVNWALTSHCLLVFRGRLPLESLLPEHRLHLTSADSRWLRPWRHREPRPRAGLDPYGQRHQRQHGRRNTTLGGHRRHLRLSSRMQYPMVMS